MASALNQLIITSRRTKGWTQEQLAEQAKLTLRTIQRLENQENQPRLHTLKAVASALDLSWERVQLLLDTAPVTTNTKSDEEQQRHLLQLINLSAIAGLFVPLFNILIPYWLIRRAKPTSPHNYKQRWQLLYKQIWWTVWTQAIILLTVLYNISVASFTDLSLLIPYLLPVLVMNGLNGLYIYRTHNLLQIS